MCHPLLMIKYSMSILTFGDVIMNKPFIAIEGPIGVGKSSLTHKISQTFNYYEENEIINENPFFLIFMMIFQNGVFKLKCSSFVIVINKHKILQN